MNKHFAESLGEFRKRITSGGSRKPLRSFKELCDELGVPQRTVMGKLKLEGAPKPLVKHMGGSSGCWYDPKEFKAWWSKQEPAKPTIPTRHCDECAHMFFTSDSEKDYHCAKGHKPRWYKQRSKTDMDYGFKRRCEDFEGEF